MCLAHMSQKGVIIIMAISSQKGVIIMAISVIDFETLLKTVLS